MHVLCSFELHILYGETVNTFLEGGLKRGCKGMMKCINFFSLKPNGLKEIHLDH